MMSQFAAVAVAAPGVVTARRRWWAAETLSITSMTTATRLTPTPHGSGRADKGVTLIFRHLTQP